MDAVSLYALPAILRGCTRIGCNDRFPPGEKGAGEVGMHPCCDNCVYSAIPAELAGSPFETPRVVELVCRRHPQEMRKPTGSWCGEFQWRPEAPNEVPSSTFSRTYRDISPLGSLDPDCF
mgnify:CR=1 FL=1